MESPNNDVDVINAALQAERDVLDLPADRRATLTRPETRALRAAAQDRFGAALTWIEHHEPGGVALVARALAAVGCRAADESLMAWAIERQEDAERYVVVARDVPRAIEAWRLHVQQEYDLTDEEADDEEPSSVERLCCRGNVVLRRATGGQGGPRPVPGTP